MKMGKFMQQKGNRENENLRQIYENLKAPTCDKECSDIDDSCSDDSCDMELFLQEADVMKNEKNIARNDRKKRETRRASTSTVMFDGNGYNHPDI